MIEILIVAALVLWSAVVVFKKVFPQTSSAVFLKLSNFCAEKGWHGLAKWLKPAAAAGCGGSCGCDHSDQTAEKKVEVQAVKWK
ncbi:hypothetical protein KAM398_17110 [Acinetobacter sp. KAM398]|uniref:Uncharacterized protein n=1 Tax=Acinetobacter towneri TaxID=202956 RepID=A0A1E8E0Q3_9GAMM|nr:MULTISPECIES: DUF6587 family protein [Acinetobacter]OFE43177.1 hypothetical protein BJN41_08985 [Acinetobacter towneri]GJC31724.1 hypothetical protein KAM392_17030 [Acinetobacter sp. KAM392]GJC34533.1 hypothetical protein KAM393_17020 [Acinetobacter sp. KAM393]GJC37354.1 hypothetical protein KAM394_16940 [Acinetobacter sp. KAM394]GJC40189.1 hypothetical protein KAM395_17100 [Acinetobacter sp. KAM395]